MEGLRQLKVIGILGIVINVIIAVVIPVGNCLSAKAEYHSYINNNMADQFTKYAINAVDYHVYYLLFFSCVCSADGYYSVQVSKPQRGL